MKDFFNNKRNIIISVVSLVLVVAIVVVAVTFNNNKIDVDAGNTTTTTTTEAAGENVTDEESTTTTSVEESSETSDKTQEEETTEKVESTTKKRTESTTGKKTESTTKKTETTTNPDKVPEDEAREGLYKYYGGKAGYEAHLEEVANYKCHVCGDHNCPSLEYGTDLLGNPKLSDINEEKCPAIINGTATCSHCGKTLVSSLDDRWLNEPDKYCDGFCYVSFG